jgi:hypothetical protein
MRRMGRMDGTIGYMGQWDVRFLFTALTGHLYVPYVLFVPFNSPYVPYLLFVPFSSP